jgi:hypothetical protein
MMNVVESSYEGAVRRLQALGHRVHDSSLSEGRMRDLEELAMIACDQNEKLEAEVAQLREEKVALQRKVAMLEAVISDPRAVLGLPDLTSSVSTMPRESIGRRRSLALPISVVAAAALLVGAVLGARTQVRALGTAMQLATVGASLTAPLRAGLARLSRPHPRFGRGDLDLTPVVAPPATPVVVPTAPKAGPAVAAAAITTEKTEKRSSKKHRSHHASRHRAQAKKSSRGPLGGLEL